MHFTLGLVLATLTSLTGSSLPSTPTFEAMPQALTVEQYVREYFIDTPVMADIASCESHFRQYDKSGSVLHGEQVYEDIGVMQINQTYHGKTSAQLGFDITTTQGNVAYAKYVYDKQGTTPWNSSKPCWGKSKNALELASK
jgi:hypothetical protein